MKEYRMVVTLVLRGPTLTKATAMGRVGVDASMATNAEGKWCLPGTLVKGKLREAWKELVALSRGTFAPAIEELLGPDPPRGDTDLTGAGRPRNARGTMRLDDFVCQSGGVPDRRRYRVRMDGETGAVDRGMYLVIESPFAPGENVVFEGAVHLPAASEEAARQTGAAVQKGLEWAAAYGSLRSVGFGTLVSVGVGHPAEVQAKTVTATTSVGRFGIRVRLDRPFCIAKRRPTATLFESEEVIPGGVLKGAVASSWMTMLGRAGEDVAPGVDPDRRELAEHFWRVRYSHVFPMPEGETKRPVVPPLSTVQVRGHSGKPGKQPFYDLAILGGPCLLHMRAPDYEPDAKEWGVVRRHFGWIDVPRQIRVRTQIDRETRSAKEKMLFAYEMRLAKGFVWLGEVDLSAVPEGVRDKVEGQLRDLLARPLRNIGKTKARAEVDVVDAVEPVVASHLDPVEGLWVLTLQAPALLVNPEGMSEASTERDLRKRYEETWSEFLPGATLVRYFARQTLAGGIYLHRQFRDGRAYRPYILTDAGSVFALRGGAAKAKVGEYLQHGLPNAQWVRRLYADDCAEADLWRHCPYIRENGFGEIAVNLDSHMKYRPSQEAYHAVGALVD